MAFIIAHGCKMNSSFRLNNNTLFFKSQDGMQCNSDATQIDLNSGNYPYKVTSSNGPSGSYDYLLHRPERKMRQNSYKK